MGHSHAHDHGNLQEASDRRILGTVALNVLLTVGQVIGGAISGSVALVADALHNLNDALALVIVYVARRVSRRRADRERTFGYQRAQVVGAMINLVALAVVGLFLGYESVLRFFEPREVGGWTMMALAGLALAVDVGTVALLFSMRKGSVNTRAAFLHTLSDALASLAVLAGGAAIVIWDVTWVDPLMSLLIVGYIFWQVAKILPDTLRVLMESAPESLDLQKVADAIGGVEGVAGAHHLHAWLLDEDHTALEAHVVIRREGVEHMDNIKAEVRDRLEQDFDIAHTTLELEFEGTVKGSDHDDSLVAERCTDKRAGRASGP